MKTVDPVQSVYLPSPLVNPTEDAWLNEAGGWLEPEKPGPWNRRWRVTAGLAERFRAQLERHRAAIAEIQEKIRGGHDDD
jgi:hypothetical protein